MYVCIYVCVGVYSIYIYIHISNWNHACDYGFKHLLAYTYRQAVGKRLLYKKICTTIAYLAIITVAPNEIKHTRDIFWENNKVNLISVNLCK